MTGPQDSYRAELQGSVLVTAQARVGDSLTLDNKAVVDYGPRSPDRESADMDLRKQLHTNLADTPIPLIWIAGHQHIRSAHTHQQKADIKRNHEVDALAKKAAGLPLPDIPPQDVSDIHVSGGPAPTPAKKVDPQQTDHPPIYRNTLDVMATTQRHAQGVLAAVALGKCMVGRVWTPMEQRHGPLRTLWKNTPHHST